MPVELGVSQGRFEGGVQSFDERTLILAPEKPSSRDSYCLNKQSCKLQRPDSDKPVEEASGTLFMIGKKLPLLASEAFC